jgi:uncharacterized protein YciI
MRKMFLIAATLLLYSISVNAQSKMTNEEIMAKVSTGRPFTLVILKKGATVPTDMALVGKLQMEHLANLFQMEKEGKISVFGPVNNDEKLQGIIIFNSTDKELIKKELSQDPFIKAGYMAFDLFEWFSIPGQKIPE